MTIRSTDPSKILLFALSLAFAIVSAIIFLLSEDIRLDYHVLGPAFFLILACVWVFTADEHWWFAFPIMAVWGGYFWVGFKVYPDEVGLFLAGAALLVRLLKHGPEIKLRRSCCSPAFAVLILYFIAHVILSIYKSDTSWLGGTGSIIRAYSHGMTYLIISWLYYKYGSSKYLAAAFVMLFSITLVRISISILNLSHPDLLNINPNSLCQFYSYTDLRFAALNEILFGLILFYMIDKTSTRCFIAVLIIAMLILVLFGAGRVSVATAISTFIIWMALAKRLRLLAILVPVLIFGALTYDYGAPIQVQRAISWVPGIGYRDVADTQSSDQWHFDLMDLGYVRWTKSHSSLLFGQSVNSEDVYDIDELDYLTQVQIAASTGRYDCTLWAVLATLGLCGGVLYIYIFLFMYGKITPIVLRDGIRGFEHAVYTVAIISILQEILFGWIRGDFPGMTLMLGIMAKSLYEDSQSQTNKSDARNAILVQNASEFNACPVAPASSLV